VDPLWSRRAVAEIGSARNEVTVARPACTVVTSDHGGRSRWWTFGGLKANASLAAMFARENGGVPRFDNYFVELPESSMPDMAVRRLAELKVSQTGAHLLSEPPGKVKFWECIPKSLQTRFMESRFTDVERAAEILTEPRLYAAFSTEPAAK
jgi:ATP-dependent Lhr-like helicase